MSAISKLFGFREDFELTVPSPASSPRLLPIGFELPRQKATSTLAKRTRNNQTLIFLTHLRGRGLNFKLFLRFRLGLSVVDQFMIVRQCV